jgi:hypothetical protein
MPTYFLFFDMSCSLSPHYWGKIPSLLFSMHVYLNITLHQYFLFFNMPYSLSPHFWGIILSMLFSMHTYLYIIASMLFFMHAYMYIIVSMLFSICIYICILFVACKVFTWLGLWLWWEFFISRFLKGSMPLTSNWESSN